MLLCQQTQNIENTFKFKVEPLFTRKTIDCMHPYGTYDGSIVSCPLLSSRLTSRLTLRYDTIHYIYMLPKAD